MKLRSGDVAPSAVLAEHYRLQAELCHQMARMTMSPFREGWVELAAEWKKLVREKSRKRMAACLRNNRAQDPRRAYVILSVVETLNARSWCLNQASSGRLRPHLNGFACFSSDISTYDALSSDSLPIGPHGLREAPEPRCLREAPEPRFPSIMPRRADVGYDRRCKGVLARFERKEKSTRVNCLHSPA